MTRRTAPFLLLLLAATLGSACSHFEKLPPPLVRRVAVLDFRIAKGHGEDPLEQRSYWFGANTRFTNMRDGAIFADALAEVLSNFDYLSQQSRADVRYYMKGKRRLLMAKFEGLENDEYERLLRDVSPLDYGIELGVDQVITGRIVDAYMTENHTIHTWRSFVKVEVDVWDMSAGEVVWSRVFERKKRFTSKADLMRLVARDVAETLDRDFYRATSP